MYSALEEPCQNCILKIFMCGEKVYHRDLVTAERNARQGAVQEHDNLNVCRPPSTPDDQFLSSTDVMYMQRYHQDMRTLTTALKGCPDLCHVFRRFGLNLVSKSYRYAALSAASFEVHRKSTDQVLQYLDMFYKHTRQAIESENFIELVYACYTAALYCFLARQYPELIKHSIGLLYSFKNLIKSDSVNIEEKFLIRCMINNVFQFILTEIEQRRLDDHWIETLDLAIGFTQSAAFLLMPQNRLLKGSGPMDNEEHNMYAKSLMLSLQIHLYHYSVIKETSTEISDSVIRSIGKLLEGIIRAVPQVVRFDKTMKYVRNVDRGTAPGTMPFFIHPADSTLIFSYLSSIILRDLIFPIHQVEGVGMETIHTISHIRSLATIIIGMKGKGIAFNPWPAISSLFLAGFASTVSGHISGEFPLSILN